MSTRSGSAPRGPDWSRSGIGHSAALAAALAALLTGCSDDPEFRLHNPECLPGYEIPIGQPEAECVPDYLIRRDGTGSILTE